MTGAVIPRINKTLLQSSTLYLAPVTDQRRALQAVSTIQRLRSELSEIESKVWEKPRQAGDLIQQLGRINHEERFQDWLDCLPFPLASILRSYHALDRTDKEKYERLLHFFEAFTVFLASIHLSAFRTSESQWVQQRRKLLALMDSQRFSLARPTFGLWSAIVQLLAKGVRSLRDGKAEDQSFLNTLYATADPAPVDMLCSTKLIDLLQRMNSFRNRWTGHGGAVTIAEARERHDQLSKELANFRDIIGTRFQQYQLIKPLEAEILEGPVFRYRARRVMGSDPQLEHETIELTTAPKTGALCMHNPGHDKALELIPLVQLRDEPQPASYFYNRSDKTELHLVSYQFASQSEVSDGNGVLTGLLNEFTRDASAPAEEQNDD